ncbi:hypothetical protein LDENG_00268750 [Lucifuga dentata]|nr:hypothetical protein LDENG_00268750 [Lucifuga dentata]
MSDIIKSFTVGYNPTKENNIFTSGDDFTGQITLELVKDCKIDSLSVQLKGKANVRWAEVYGKVVVVYYAKEKYFSVKQFIIQHRGNDVSQGCHVYPFTFQIPAQDLPSSFKGGSGKIRYTLEAKLSRPMRTDSKAKTEFTVLQKNMDSYYQGEGIKVVAWIQNNSSREIKPKYCFYRKRSYFAQRRRVKTKDLVKEVGEPIPPSTGQTVTRIITIPPTTSVSILNCNIIRAEYRLRVYLDIKYVSDPEIKFPIVILPAFHAPDQDQLPASLGFEPFGNPNITTVTNYPQNSTTSGPFALSLSYEMHETDPLLADFDGMC